MLWLTCWFWGTKYTQTYVDRLASGVARGMRGHPYRWAVFEPPYVDPQRPTICRLAAFDPIWQASRGIQPDDRVVTFDLDLIITADIFSLFDRPEPFVAVKGANQGSVHPCPLNGSVWMLRAGYRPDVWSALDDAAVHDDQWMCQMMPDFAGWQVGESGIYCFGKAGWPRDTNDALPPGARIVAFPGWHRDPSQFTHIDWVKEHWR
jgi:hypothetical protein